MVNILHVVICVCVRVCQQYFVCSADEMAPTEMNNCSLCQQYETKAKLKTVTLGLDRNRQ